MATQQGSPTLLQKIQAANPDVKANSQYINAVYQYVYGRNATAAEIQRFSGQTASKVANFVAGKPIFQQSTGAGQQAGTQAPSGVTIDQKLIGLGISQDIINSLSPEQKAMFASVAEAITAQYNQGKTVPPTFTPQDLQNIMTQAQNDPNIDAYYKEQMRVGQATFATAVQSLGADYNAAKAENERQFGYQAKDLAEQEAAAGRAYSGFREQAKQRLQGDQSYIIESSKRDLQKQLQSAAAQQEAQYGTSALPPGANLGLTGAAGQDVSYTPVGGVAGSLEASKLADIRNRASDIQQQELLAGGPPNQAPVPTAAPAPATTPSPAAAPTTAAPKPTTTTTAPKQGTRQYYESQGYKYISTIATRDQLIKQGVKPVLLNGMYFYK